MNIIFKTLYFSFILLSFSSAFGNGLDYKNRAVTYYLGSEPPTLETMDEATSTSVMVTGHTFEGLMRYDAQNQLTYGVAKSHAISEDGRTYTFKLRENALWSDGIPVKAQDFEFAWKECINPKKASKYAFIMYFLKNAEKANGGKVGLDEIGVKALDDFTLEVTLEQPCGFFLPLTTFLTYMPCRESFYKKYPGTYAAEAANCLYNGPFKMVEWKHESSILLKKNEKYWNRQAVWLEPEQKIPHRHGI